METCWFLHPKHKRRPDTAADTALVLEAPCVFSFTCVNTVIFELDALTMSTAASDLLPVYQDS